MLLFQASVLHHLLPTTTSPDHVQLKRGSGLQTWKQLEWRLLWCCICLLWSADVVQRHSNVVQEILTSSPACGTQKISKTNSSAFKVQQRHLSCSTWRLTLTWSSRYCPSWQRDFNGQSKRPPPSRLSPQEPHKDLSFPHFYLLFFGRNSTLGMTYQTLGRCSHMDINTDVLQHELGTLLDINVLKTNKVIIWFHRGHSIVAKLSFKLWNKSKWGLVVGAASMWSHDGPATSG